MAPPVRELLLARYRDVAEALTHPACPSTSHDEKSSTSASGEDHPREAKEGGAHDEQQARDPTVAAVTELLARQAHAVMKLHDSLEATSEEPPRFNNELFRRRIADLQSISTSKFYAYRYDRLPAVWRQIYADTLILDTYHALVRPLLGREALPGETLDIVVDRIDRALITAGGGVRAQWLEKTLQLLEMEAAEAVDDDDDDLRPTKRQRTEEYDSQENREPRATPSRSRQRCFSMQEPYARPALKPGTEVPRHSGWTMAQFEDYMNPDDGRPWPVIFNDLMGDWPALADRPWKSPDYLLSRTFGGRRLVPVEVGRSYVDEGWGQELVQFRAFLRRYIDDEDYNDYEHEQGDGNKTPDKETGENSASDAKRPVGYLAQHNLFQQIPSLRNDIRVPDFCWVDVPPHPVSPSLDHPPVATPQLNAWFGPARTITPLHTDAYHNLLCQAVGAKFVRLYPPWAAPESMRPRAAEHGVDMSNTSAVDVGVLEGWDEPAGPEEEEEVARVREALEGVEYRDCILEPGDTLVIPIGWWHYVRSLSVSFSVSFWWN